MKNLKKTFQNGLATLCLLFVSMTNYSQTISTHFFGQNAWMPYAVGSSIVYGKLDQHWSDIKNSNASMIRYGGITVDENMTTNAQYIGIIDSIRANGMEPIIEVPFNKWTFTAQQAADIVQYINVTKGKNIKYWIIGNEPELGYSYTTASQIAAYIKPFASAMKNVDPSIKIVGPESAWLNQSIVNGLTTAGGADDITGKDGAGRYYLDVFSFHTYPFNGSQTRAQVLSKLTEPYSYEANLIMLNSRIAACNSAHSRTGTSALKLAITEANINWKNSSSDNLNGVGANSFIGGQFVAEMLGIGMKQGVDFINIWSVIEGNSQELNIGYLDRTTGNKKPLYYHFKMMADNFRGNSVNCTTNQTNVKSFGSQDGQEVSVLILNEDLASNYNYTVRLNTSAVSGSNPLEINVNAGIAKEYNDVLSNQSSVLLTFNSSGDIVKKCEYSLAGNATANLPPTCTEFINTVMPIELVSFNAEQNENKIDLSWITATESNNNYFTIEKSTHPENTFTAIGTVDGAGNSTTALNYSFADDSIANGDIYYYRLKQTGFDNKFTYSKTISVAVTPTSISAANGASSELNVFPNPSDGKFTVQLNSEVQAKNYEIKLFNLAGQEVYRVNSAFLNSREEIKLSSNFTDGVYIVQVKDVNERDKNKFMMRKIIVQR